jgi:hypothetical protein
MTKERHNAELRDDASRIVAGVENYSSADRTRRGAEVMAAFPPVKAAAKTATKAKPAAKAKSAAKPAAKKSTRTVAKVSSKGPTPAGMSTGSHSGDVC